MTINQKTELYAVIGHPVGHSLSPALHNAAFSATGLNAVYMAFDVQDLESCIRGIRAMGIKGLSITIPHKSAVIPFLNAVDEIAGRVGAVNTVLNDDGYLIGSNTDVGGALSCLENRVRLAHKSCLLIGAGGAARAIGFALRQRDVDLQVVNRNPQRGKTLAKFLDCPFVPLADLPGIAADILINTTPVGMEPHTDRFLINENLLKERMLVMDIIYNPLETKLLRMAKAKGCQTINGLEMFLHQGAEQFRLWSGLEPPVEHMARAVAKALDRNC